MDVISTKYFQNSNQNFNETLSVEKFIDKIFKIQHELQNLWNLTDTIHEHKMNQILSQEYCFAQNIEDAIDDKCRIRWTKLNNIIAWFDGLAETYDGTFDDVSIMSDFELKNMCHDKIQKVDKITFETSQNT